MSSRGMRSGPSASRRERLREHVKSYSHQLLTKMRSAKMRRSRHKITFTLVLCDICLTTFILGADPRSVYYWHSVKAVVLVTVRAINYRMQQMHYYLLDFCYWPNIAILGYCWLFPRWEALLLAGLGCCGLLLFSVPFFRNSYVFHSIDRVTCVYSHISPPLTAWTLMWVPQRPYSEQWVSGPIQWLGLQPTQFSRPTGVGVMDVLGPTLVLYVTWAVFYYSVQWIILSDRIEAKNRPTLFKQIGLRYGHVLRWMGMESRPRVMYVVMHLVLFSIGLPWGCVLEAKAQAVVLAFCIVCAFYNGAPCVHADWFTVDAGAQYYIDHFVKVYEVLYAEVEANPTENEQVFTPLLRPESLDVGDDSDWSDYELEQ